MATTEMCLSDESREEYWRLARAMDDERLHKLDHYYRSERGRPRDTVDLELKFIVSREIENRRQVRVRRLKRALWLSSRRGRLVEAIKRWLVRHRFLSSARLQVQEPPQSAHGLWMLRALISFLLLIRALWRIRTGDSSSRSPSPALR